MKMTTTSRKKLTLHRDRLRTLSSIALDGVQGGGAPALTQGVDCATKTR